MAEPRDEDNLNEPDGPGDDQPPQPRDDRADEPGEAPARGDEQPSEPQGDGAHESDEAQGGTPAEPAETPTGGDQDAQPDSGELARRDDAPDADGAEDVDDEGFHGSEQQEYEDGYDYEGWSDEDDYDYDEYDHEEYGYDDEYDDEYEDEYEDEEEEDLDEVGQQKMTLVEHLEELRTRIIRALLGLVIGMVVALSISPQMIELINQPLYEHVGREGVITIDMVSPFLLYLRISLYLGVIIASPWIFYQIWMFIAAGLYKHERKYVTYAVPFSAALFITGALFFLFAISRYLLGFFYAFARDWMGVNPQITLDNHVTFMTNMMLVFGFCFQMPIAVLLLAKMGLVSVRTLNRYRRYVIVGIMILSAFCTSPSPLDQIALAIPMWLLYEVGILLAWFLVEKKRRAQDEAMGYEPIDEDE